MPRQKRKASASPQATTHGSRRRNRSASLKGPIDKVVQIDYFKLAAEIIKQQQSTNATNNVNEARVASQSGNELAHYANDVSCTNNEDIARASTATEDSNTMSQNVEVINLINKMFSGESAREQTGTNLHKDMTTPQIEITNGIPLGASVGQKIKQNIWENEFIDLRSLLPNQFDEPVSVTISAGTINFQQGNKQKYPLSISQWTDAFHIFICIFIQKFPSEAANMLKYCSTVREIQRLSEDVAWRTYDTNFRRLRQTMNLPWQKPIEELRMRATSQSQKPKAIEPFRKGNQSGPKVKVCFAFNRNERCKSYPCPFPHICQQCGGSHPKYNCRVGSQQQTRYTNTTTPLPSQSTSTASDTGKSKKP